jgi:hypothetical protein
VCLVRHVVAVDEKGFDDVVIGGLAAARSVQAVP